MTMAVFEDQVEVLERFSLDYRLPCQLSFFSISLGRLRDTDIMMNPFLISHHLAETMFVDSLQ